VPAAELMLLYIVLPPDSGRIRLKRIPNPQLRDRNVDFVTCSLSVTRSMLKVPEDSQPMFAAKNLRNSPRRKVRIRDF